MAASSNRFYVYCWRRPDTGEVFYVGKGSGRRDTQPKRHNPIFMAIIEKLGRSGLRPAVDRMADGLTEEQAFNIEREEILRRGRRNIGTGPLANLTDGGEGASGHVPTPETLEKRSKSLRGIPRTAEWLSRMSIGLAGNQNARGVVRSIDTRARMSAAQSARPPQTADTREKISDSVTPVVRAAGPRSDNSSGYKGVSFCKDRGSWQAGIFLGGKRKSLGRFKSAEEAAAAYDRAAVGAWGPDCFLNFPTPENDNQRPAIAEAA